MIMTYKWIEAIKITYFRTERQIMETVGDGSTVPRHNQKLDYEGLRYEAEQAVRFSGQKQLEIAEALGVGAPSISRAIKEAGSKFASLQRQIIEHLTDYHVEEMTLFRALRK